jgi:hypothetical protein
MTAKDSGIIFIRLGRTFGWSRGEFDQLIRSGRRNLLHFRLRVAVPTRVVAEIFSRADDFLLGSGKCFGDKSFAFGKGTLVLCLLYVRADEVAQSGHAKEDIESDSFYAWPVFSCALAPGSSL